MNDSYKDDDASSDRYCLTSCDLCPNIAECIRTDAPDPLYAHLKSHTNFASIRHSPHAIAETYRRSRHSPYSSGPSQWKLLLPAAQPQYTSI
jgi:hypothetical protein